MLEPETRRRIDSARDILVGKVPDPKSQVEQITLALIYKFMDDMDAEAEELGGERTFFTGEFARYGWARMLDVSLGAQETLNRYAEALEKMKENQKVPQLFRDIFKNAFLPYRDPETLKSFLKVINGFEYDHSERLGDAFEYLLNVLGTQADAGQFRTPRHIIDFMVELVDPRKEDRVLDPACGTAGFLISAYRHIMKRDREEKAEGKGMTPDERTRLMENFEGYDISPDMVRLSLVNLYLHGFTTPKIYEYDTLTSDERWKDSADVILANPPFMSPKGGIRPHKRFSVESNRSEVLFVDYIAEHLTPNGRAAVIVPEGVIFQSGKAYKALRKMLVEQDYLVGVISLPAGVFNPYSGVKTSILWIDRSLAKKASTILFCKIEADGFDLGAQRRPNGKNDLPKALAILTDFRSNCERGILIDTGIRVKTIQKVELRDGDEFNLNLERYIGKIKRDTIYQLKEISGTAAIIAGQSPSSEFYNEKKEGLPFYQGKADFGNIYLLRPRVWTTSVTREAYPGDVLMSVRAPVGPVNIAQEKICIGRGLCAIRPNANLNSKYLFYILRHHESKIKGGGGLVFDNISKEGIGQIKIPLPSIEEQEEIVSEIESYQKIVDGAQMVVKNYRPRIEVDPSWPVVKLGEVCEKILSGGTPSTKVEKYWNGKVPWITSADIQDIFNIEIRSYTTEEGIKNSATNLIPKGNIIVVTRVGLGKIALNSFDVCINQDCQGLIIDRQKVYDKFLLFSLLDKVQGFKQSSQGSTIQGVTKDMLINLEVSLPDLATQKEIVTQVSKEYSFFESAKESIMLFEEKIRARVAKVWGE